MAKVVPNSATTASGRASVATSKSAGGRPSNMSRTPPPTRCAWWPASRSRRQSASTSAGTSARSASSDAGDGGLMAGLSSRRDRARAGARLALDRLQRHGRRALLRLLLRAPAGAGPLAPGERQRHLEPLVVVGAALGDDLIDGRRLPERLRPLLQPRLVVEPRVRVDVGQLGLKQPRHDRGDGVEPAVEIDGAHQRLQRVGQDRRTRAPAGPLLAAADEEEAPEVERARRPRQPPLAHQRRPRARQIALGAVGEAAHQQIAHHQRQHRVAQKLQPLVVGRVPAPAPRSARRCASAPSRRAPDRERRTRDAPPGRRGNPPFLPWSFPCSSRFIGLLVSRPCRTQPTSAA